jgi:hypothetical protein
MNERFLMGIILAGIPIALLAHHTKKVLAEEKAKSRTPFTDKLLRPAGESLRLKIDEIYEKMSDTAMIMVGLIVLPAMFAMQAPVRTISVKLIVYLTVPAFCWAFAVKQWLKFRELRKDLRNYRLGFEGERYIGGELTQFLGLPVPNNYRVYHDFLFDMKPGGTRTDFNIDHIAIGEDGVFAIETKTRRKPLKTNEGGNKNHEVTYDGAALTWPSGFKDTASINQARRAAEDLSVWLTGSSKSPVLVIPVVVVPGWMVKRIGKGVVRVFNEKELLSIKNDKADNLAGISQSKLSGEQQRMIADRIDDQCRNIDHE